MLTARFVSPPFITGGRGKPAETSNQKKKETDQTVVGSTRQCVHTVSVHGIEGGWTIVCSIMYWELCIPAQWISMFVEDGDAVVSKANPISIHRHLRTRRKRVLDRPRRAQHNMNLTEQRVPDSLETDSISICFTFLSQLNFFTQQTVTVACRIYTPYSRLTARLSAPLRNLR